MSKATKNERISTLERQVTALITLVKMKGYNESEPQIKRLDQSAFDHPYATDRFKYVALNADGQAVFFESKPVISNCLDIWVVHTGSVMPMLKGYDASNWQNSLIERDIAKELLEVDLSSELTGSELCRAMIIGDRDWVLAYVSNENDATALFHKNAMVVTDLDLSEDAFYCRGENWAYAVPINNQGEPLTASEVGL